jgi:hypothetical protein
MRAPKPLVVRAGLSRTFGGLAGFAAVSLLSLGIYLLADAFAHPVDAQAAALIVAAFAMALAIVLFFFLFKSRRIPQMSQHQTLEDFLHLGTDAASPAPPLSVHQDDLRKDLAYQRPYVDRSRIRP